MAFRPLKMLKNLLLLLLLVWAAKKIGKLVAAPFKMLAKPAKKIFDAARKAQPFIYRYSDAFNARRGL